MSNEAILEKLTLGKDNIETVKVNDVEIELRPLTSGEVSKLRKLDKKPFSMKMSMADNGKIRGVSKETDSAMDIGMGEFTEAQVKVMYSAVAWSMDIDESAVENFANGVPEEIFKHVVRISKLESTDLTLIKQFR